MRFSIRHLPVIKCFSIICIISFFYSCSSGSSSRLQPIGVEVAPSPELDHRIPFESFSNTMVSPWGEVTIEYSMSDFSPSSNWPSNDKYKIEDYGFLRVTSDGTHPGDSSNPDEITEAGPYFNNAQWFEANLNGDDHTDLIYVGNNVGTREFILEDLMLTFINDGQGHFELSADVFADGSFPCVQGGRSWLSQEINVMHPCGNQNDYTNGKIVADFNNDGISDYYDTSILFLSNAEGKLENKSFTNLPNMFFEEAHGQIFVHDATYGDLDGDGDLDIFTPIFDYTRHGYKFGGDIDPCSGCSEVIPYTALINDGNGQFIANHKIPIFDYWVEVDYDNWGNNIDQIWPTTATIGDFDNDGFGDIALGWFNPRISHLYGFSENSAGVVYFNDGHNDWTTRSYVELPANYFGDNGNANDMEAFDFNNDGYIDIILASTIHEPYYHSRVIQFFKNEKGNSFTDVTSSISPDHAKYANGNPFSNWWVGQGKLHILDYDHDGDLDIIDSNTRTSVLINNITSFDLYDNFVDLDEDILLWPVEIDGKYHYDFIGSTFSCGSSSCTTDYYQLLDPPNLALIDDFSQKPSGFISSLVEASYLGDHLRDLSNNSETVFYTDLQSSMLGYSFHKNYLSLLTGRVRGAYHGNFFGTIINYGSIKAGFISSHLSTISESHTQWFGDARAELYFKNHESFIETSIIKTNSFSLSLGRVLSRIHLKDFLEEGSPVNLRYNQNNFIYNAYYSRFIYTFDMFGVKANLGGGKRTANKLKQFRVHTPDGVFFNTERDINNEYISLDLMKDIYYLRVLDNPVGKQIILGFHIDI